MGMYCACNWKMTNSMLIDIPNGKTVIYESDPNGCKCDWEGWNSLYDWPEERKNKDKPFKEPSEEGKYIVRIQDCNGDRYESESEYKFIPRIEKCKYTGRECPVKWSRTLEEQPYA